MNKPARPFAPDHDLGPLDENGEQIWSPEEAAAIARVTSDPAFLRSVARAEAQADAGGGRTHAEHIAWMEERKREWRARRG
jgi:hypothetical protein